MADIPNTNLTIVRTLRQQCPLALVRNRNFDKTCTWFKDGNAADLTQWVLKAEVRSLQNPTAPLLYTFNILFPNPEIVGQFQLFIPSNITNSFTWSSGFYDVIAINKANPLDVREVLAGPILVSDGVTNV